MLLILVSLALSASASDIKWLYDEGMVIVEPVVFSEFREDFNISMVLFYGKGCGNCQWMMKDYKQAALQARMENLPVAFAKMNGEAHKEFVKTMGVTGFPHIHVFGPTKTFGYKYRGKMTAVGFIEELKKHLAGTFTPSKRVVLDLTAETFSKLIQQEVSLVLFTDEKKPDTLSRASFINDVALALQEKEIEGTIGVLNVTKYTGLVPAEIALKEIAIYREGEYYPIDASLDPYTMQKEITDRIYLSSVELDASSDQDDKNSYMLGKNSDDVLLVLFPGKTTKDQIYKDWIEFCYITEEIKCAHSFDNSIIESYNAKTMMIVWTRPAFYMLGAGQEKQTKIPVTVKSEFPKIYHGKIFKNQIPLVGDHDMTNLQTMAEWQTHAVVVSYFNVDYSKKGLFKTKAMMKRIAEVAKKYWPLTKMNNFPDGAMVRFMIGDEIANQDILTKTELQLDEPDDDPVIVIHNHYNHTIHAPSQDDQVDKNMKFEKYLELLVDHWINGTLPEHHQYENEPKKQTYPVLTLVRSTYMQVLMDKSKDILLFFTKKECTECQIILEWLNIIATELKDEPIVIAKLDTGENDVSRELFINANAPKLYFMPGGEKLTQAISFSYEREITINSIKKFIGRNVKVALKKCAADEKPSFGDIIANGTETKEKTEEKIEEKIEEKTEEKTEEKKKTEL